MEADVIWNDAAIDQVTAPRSNNPFASISQLFTELLVEIFQLSLPDIDVKSPFTTPSNLRSHMKRLYIMRSVTKRWQGVIEGTPSFWTTIAFNLPTHVNETSILRSSNLPLSIVCCNPRPARPNDSLSATEFFQLIQSTLPRWSSLTLELYDLIAMPSYLGAPLPLLQTIVVKSVCHRSSEYKPLELGDTSNLRSVKLSRVSVRWRTGCFVQLKCLKLKDVTYDSLTAQPLLDALRASPLLEVLKLTNMKGTDIPQLYPTITLHHLKQIKLYDCALSLVECILGRIQAPSCTGLTLGIIDQPTLNAPHFLDVTLKPFHPTPRRIHRMHGGSEVILDSHGVEWHAGNRWDKEGFLLYMEQFYDPFFTDWVDRTLEDESGPMIIFGYGSASSEAVLRSVASMRRVTKVAIGEEASIRLVLQLLSKPLTTSASLPSLPCLQELDLPPQGWNTRDLLEMVQSRFCTLGWETMERTPLTINVVSWGWWGKGGPGLLVDFATLQNIRKTCGVERFSLGGRKHPEGTLAMVWNDEASEAVWV